MSNDPSHGTPLPSNDGESPKNPPDSLTEGGVSATNETSGSAPRKKPNTDAAKGDNLKSDAGNTGDGGENGAHDSTSGDMGSTTDDPGQAEPLSDPSKEVVTSDEKSPQTDPLSEDSDSKADDGESPTAGGSVGHDEDHEWHDEHDDYNPEYDDPYHDEHQDGIGREGEDAHYYQDDDYHHHDEDHGSGHSIGAGSAGLGQTAGRSTKKSAISSDDDWDDDDEEGGGPVKNFLEHLEDLRWVIIKCVVAVMVCMCICLVGANRGVQLLTKPLEEASQKIGNSVMEKAREDRLKAQADGLIKPTLQFQIGTNHMDLFADDATFRALGGNPNSTNTVIPMRLAPQIIGSNVVMVFRPGEPKDVQDSVKLDLPKLVPRGPLTPFMLALKTAFFGGFGLASPFVFFFIGQFVLPALHRHEKKYLGYGVFIGAGLFLLGATFAYLVITKLMLSASIMFADWLGFHSTIWIIDDYVAVILKLLLGVGLGFELPVVLLTLVRIGILDYQKLNTLRAYAVVIILVLSALLTPPDVISQVLMAMPLYLLYEVSVIIAYIWFRQEQREEAAETDD